MNMSNGLTSLGTGGRDARVVRWGAAWGIAIAIAIVSSTGHAQTPIGTLTAVQRSGLHSIVRGNTASITIAEVGAAKAVSSVRIELLDDADRLVAAADGILRRGEPVRLRTPIHAVERLVQLRAIVRIETLVGGGSVPITVFEEIGPDSFVFRIGVCGPPLERGGGQEMCPGWHFTTAVG